MPSIVAIVLAAGKGTRMGSDRAKVLHQLRGRPLVAYPIETARAAGAEHVVVVVGHQAQRVRATVVDSCGRDGIAFAEQAEQLGTGHAVGCALPAVPADAEVALILSGDVPLLRSSTLVALRDGCRRTPAGLAFATFRPADTHGYGRVLRDEAGDPIGIREQRDASEAERRIDECNAGIYAVSVARLREDLPRLQRHNAQGELYLTDLVALAAARGPVATVVIDPLEAAGVNTPEQLAALELGSTA